MAFTLVDHKIQISAGAGATQTTTFDAARAATAGNLLVAYYNVPEGAAEITPDAVSGYTKIDVLNTGDVGYAGAWYWKIAAGGETAITITHTGVSRERWTAFMEWSGNHATPSDTGFTATSVPSLNQTAATVTAGAAAEANELYLGQLGWRDASTTVSGVTSGWTTLGAETTAPSGGTGNTSVRGSVYYDITSNTASETPTLAGTLSTGERLGVSVIAFKQAATGIAFDAASSSTYQTATSSYNWSHTCTGSDRYLLVGVSMLSVGGSSVSSITYNSVNLTKLGHIASVSGAVRSELWGLVAPSTGSNSIAVTLSGALDSAANASSYTGVHQTSPTEAFNSASATNVGAADATVDITTVADNDWVIDNAATDDTAITVGAGQTQRGNVTGTLGSGAMSSEGPKTPAGAVTMNWANVAALATWSTVGIALRPTAASSLTFHSLLLHGVGD